MGLRTLAEKDLGRILEDKDRGFGWDITLTDPAGKTEPLIGFSNDISQFIDPDTGQLVAGQLASVAIRISTITAAGFTSLPRNISDESAKPWVVQFNDINGNAGVFKVRSSEPDRTIGLLLCVLENYKQ